MHRVCSLEIKAHYLDVTAFLCSFLLGPKVLESNSNGSCASEKLAPTQR